MYSLVPPKAPCEPPAVEKQHQCVSPEGCTGESVLSGDPGEAAAAGETVSTGTTAGGEDGGNRGSTGTSRSGDFCKTE